MQAELDEVREQAEMEASGKESLSKKKKSLDAQLEEYASRVDELEMAKQKLERQKRDLEKEVESLNTSIAMRMALNEPTPTFEQLTTAAVTAVLK